MKLLYIFLSLFLIIGCRTSKNIVEKSKESFSKSEIKINKVDSITKIDKLNKIDNSFRRQFSDYKEKLDISFNGLSNEDTFELTFTENGFKAKGKGSVNQKTEINKKDSSANNKVDEVLKENSEVRKNEVNQSKIEESKSKVDKKKENKSTGFNWNFTIVLVVGVVVSLVLFWKFGLPNKR
ncbi:hypothetical protein [Empedobacter brevis]|uniref:hypothetical protein n=1 Tax=Empedobacter brevis TaxID=247 RepID=UPI00333F0A5B